MTLESSVIRITIIAALPGISLDLDHDLTSPDRGKTSKPPERKRGLSRPTQRPALGL